MSHSGTHLEAVINNRLHRFGLCRTLLKACPGMIAISLLIQISPLDVSAEWKIMQWQPFQIRAELAPHAGKSKAVKRGKTVLRQTVKIKGDNDVGTENLQRSLQVWPGAQSHTISGLPGQTWRGYLWRSETFFALPQSGMQNNEIFSSDLFRNVPGQDDLLNRLADGPPAAVTGNGSALYFRLSFFNRDMQYPNRNVAERDRSRHSASEMLFRSSEMRSQPFPETIGRIFEPRFDLGIAF